MVVLRPSEDQNRKASGRCLALWCSHIWIPCHKAWRLARSNGCALNYTLPPESAGLGLGGFPLPREKGDGEEEHLGMWTWSQHTST